MKDSALKTALGIERDVLARERRLSRLDRTGLTKSGREHKANVTAGVARARETILSNRKQAGYIHAFIGLKAREADDYDDIKKRISELDAKDDPNKYPPELWTETERVTKPIYNALEERSNGEFVLFDSLDPDMDERGGLVAVDAMQRLGFSEKNIQAQFTGSQIKDSGAVHSLAVVESIGMLLTLSCSMTQFDTRITITVANGS